MKAKPLVSVVIASYNHRDYITETIHSIWRQNYSNIEVIVVDDCSPDDSWMLLQELSIQSPIPMKISRNLKNSGPAETFNAARSEERRVGKEC